MKSNAEDREISNVVRVQEHCAHETLKKTNLPSTASAIISRNLCHKIQCVYCRGSHYLSACDKVTDCQVLLQTARTKAFASNGAPVSVWMLLDSGS